MYLLSLEQYKPIQTILYKSDALFLRLYPFFSVTDKPVIKKNPLTDKSAADLGDTVRLVCEARGVPNVTFYWGRLGGQRLAPGLKYNMVTI